MQGMGEGRLGKRYVVILLIMVALVFVVGYILLSQAVGYTGYSGYTLTVKVIDSSTGYPIAGVNVTVDDNTTAETDSDGMTRFNLPPGDHVISLQKDGYKPKSFTAGLSSDNLVTLDMLTL